MNVNHLYGLFLVRLSKLPSRLSSPYIVCSQYQYQNYWDQQRKVKILLTKETLLVTVHLPPQLPYCPPLQDHLKTCSLEAISASWHYQQQSRWHLHLPGRFSKRPPLVVLLRRQNLLHLLLLLSRPVHSTLYSQTAILTPILLGFNTFNFAGASAASPILNNLKRVVVWFLTKLHMYCIISGAFVFRVWNRGREWYGSYLDPPTRS